MGDLAIKSYVDLSDPRRIYGEPVVQYEVDGVRGACFLDAVVFAALKQSHSLEGAALAVSSVVTKRQEEVEALGSALATLAEALGSMDPKSKDVNRHSSISAAKLKAASDTLAFYGQGGLQLESDGQITYANAYRSQARTQVYFDGENNELQRDLTSLNGMISKRDNAFSLANRVVQKASGTASNTIRAMAV